ncbi:MAG: sensor domain-containing diguanylate cyclase [Nitrospirae bacterium]|nr:sensor domain-containing diguanylate cyclase [Nitrospirota bacterium]
MKKKTILLFVKNRSVITFLETFFKLSGKYRRVNCDSADALRDGLAKFSPSAVIADNALLPLVPAVQSKVPVLAMIEGARGRGIAAAIDHKADLYLHKPFLDRDLEHKLALIIKLKEENRALRQEVQNLQTINDLVQLISSTRDPHELLYRIVKKIAEIMPVTRCSIIRIDWLRKFAYVVASYETPNLTAIKLSLKKYPEIEEALLNKKPVVIRDIMSDPLMAPVRDIVGPLGIRSILVMPIIFEEKVIGTLFLRTSRTLHEFTENEVQLLRTISDASANTLYNAFLFSQVEDEKTRLEKLAITDYLTGIYNIRYFYHRIIEEFSRSDRYGLPISCLMLDIDFFKKINDTYGHKTGDAVLKEFAQLLKHFTRKSDVLARYGGEEFIVMLPHTSLDGTVAEAERIRNAIKNHKFKSLSNQTGITVSIGISVFPSARIKTHDELISAADDALYEAKKSGRDRVIVFD